jgi:DNA-directed RNA polymerase specialized sigma24 family protein
MAAALPKSMPSARTPSTHDSPFPHTQWSVISMARGENADQVGEGLRQLALNYWRPLYLYLRKRGESHEDASDDVQGFFAFVFSSGFLEHVDREGGKFRSYLLTSLERWRSRNRTRDRALKRGGLVVHVSLEELDAMEGAPAVSYSGTSAELAFDRQWAAELIRCSVSALQEDFRKRGRQAWFDTLSPALPGGAGLPPYTTLAEQLQCSEGAVKKGVFDLRQAFAARLREEIRATVRSNEDAEEELRYLVSVMGN